MRLLEPRALVGGALLVTAAVGGLLVARRPLRSEGTLAPVGRETPAAPSLSAESQAALPTIEPEPTVDVKLIPTLRMPFPAGVVVLCSQGNASSSHERCRPSVNPSERTDCQWGVWWTINVRADG
jgi:hypothetical protein